MEELKIDLINTTLEAIHYSEVELQRIIDDKYGVSYIKMINLMLEELDRIDTYRRRISLINEYFVEKNNNENKIEE